jgi:hypothetical protein
MGISQFSFDTGSMPRRTAHRLLLRGSAPVIWGIAPNRVRTSRKGAAGAALPHIGRHSRERVFTQPHEEVGAGRLYE